MSLLEVRNLSHRFSNGTIGLDDITLTIESGELVVLAGPNGSGKTVLIKHLNGLLAPTAGSVSVDGISVTGDVAGARRKVGLVFQDADSQIVGQSVEDDVAFGPRNLGLPNAEVEERVDRSIEAVGLRGLEKRTPHRLSGGEKRRLAIAGILAMDPRLVVLDEPFSGLDYPGVKQVLAEIVRLHNAGHTLIVATHEVEKILAHATRVLVVERGRLVEDGAPARVLEAFERHSIRRPIDDGRGVAGMTWLR